MTGRYLRFVCCAAFLLGTGLSKAQEATASSTPIASATPASDALPVTIKLVSTKLEAEAIRSAISSELRVAVRLEDSLVDEGLAVTVKWRLSAERPPTQAADTPAGSQE